jgi:acetyl-CoA carboxylase carboxyl transferase subunit alpha
MSIEPLKPGFEFEKPVHEIEQKIHDLEQQADSAENSESLRTLRKQRADMLKQLYANLNAWQSVKVARHERRPHTIDYLSLVFEEFVELHGDKLFGDDRAIRSGFAKIDRFKVLVIGHQKGRNYKDRQECFFGCAHPEGYRKAMGKMRLAAKYGLPVICFIDTPGAYPGIGAEERGQAQVIAENMFEMSRLPTPIICVVIGEGGSGGALGIGVGDRVAMLQHAYYSVISPEGCAGILWKSAEYAERAAIALKFTAKDLLSFNVVDDIIEEPLGGAHRDHHQMASRLKQFLTRTLSELVTQPLDQLLESRYQKFRRMGVFLENAPAVEQASGIEQATGSPEADSNHS